MIIFPEIFNLQVNLRVLLVDTVHAAKLLLSSLETICIGEAMSSILNILYTLQFKIS